MTGSSALGSVLTAASGFAQETGSGMAADWVKERLSQPGASEVLENHDLSRAVGASIVNVLASYREDLESGPLPEAIKLLEKETPTLWDELPSRPLSEADLSDIFARPAKQQTGAILTREEWREVVDQLVSRAKDKGILDKRVRGRKASDVLVESIRDAMAKRLHAKIGFALREVLKGDAAAGGKAYPGLVLMLLGEVLASVKAQQPREGAEKEAAQQVVASINQIRGRLSAELAALDEAGAVRHREGLKRLDALQRDLQQELGAIRQEVEEVGKKVEEAQRSIQNTIELSVGRLVQREQATAKSHAGTLAPARRTAHFVGRDDQLKEVLSALENHRLVAVWGPGGIGKSTFVRHLYYQIDGQPWAEDGVDYIDLSKQISARAIVEETAARLGLQETPPDGYGLLQRLELRGRRLYMLDDLQQALAADEAGTLDLVQTLSGYDADLRVLLTCRRELDAGRSFRLGRLDDTAAEELFREIAEEARYAWQEGDASVLADLLRELDGYPLAIELAAGLLKTLRSLSKLRTKWNERHTSLLRKMGERQDRLSSLDVSLELSYDDLASFYDPGTAYALFALLADVPAGATPELIEALFDLEGLDAAEALRKRGFVYREGGRYRMLVPVRHFAATKATPDNEAWRSELDAFLLALTQDSLERERWIRDDGSLYRLMDAELPNIHAALERAAHRGDDAYMAAMTQDLRRMYGRNFGKAESKTWLVKGQDAAHRIGDQYAWAQCTKGLGEVARLQDDYEAATGYYEAALARYKEIGDRLGAAHCMWGLGEVARLQNDYEAATGCYEQALDAYETLGDRFGAAHCTTGLGDVAYVQNDYEAATGCYEQALDAYEALGNRQGAANCTKGLGDVAYVQNDYEAATGYYEAALARYKEIGERYGRAWTHYRLGAVLVQMGQVDRGVTELGEAARLFEAVGLTEMAAQTRALIAKIT